MKKHDLIVIGAGPGGYVAAIRAAQLGMNVACIEKEAALGGTCLRVGCIPSKTLLESSELFAEASSNFADHGIVVKSVQADIAKMQVRKDRVVSALTKGVEGLFKKNNVTRYTGHARLTGGTSLVVESSDGKSESLEAKNILIATGSKPASLPGIEFDGNRVGTSTEALSYSEIPKKLVVIGAGYIGLEIGSVWRRLGSEVVVLEYLNRIFPGTDSEIANEARKLFEKQGIQFHLGCRVTKAAPRKNDCIVEYEGGEPISCDKVLVAVGRRPNTDGLGLEAVGITTERGGQIPIDDHWKTTAPGIYAIGDVVRGAMLAHKAEEEGVACVEKIATGVGHVNYNTIPAIAYTHPEVAGVGKTEDQLKEAGIDYRRGTFSFRGNGPARALGQVDGMIKVLADRKTDRILGVHIIGPRGGELIAEAAVAMEFGATSEDLARCCHAHPTLSEALREAALAVDGRAIHA